MVWLKSYQRLGYFPKVEDVPSAVVRQVRDALGLAGDVELEQVADRTAKRHREFVRARIKVTYDAVRVRQVAEQAIRKAEAAHALRAGEARAAVIARPVLYAAVWRSSRNCHQARAPSAAALVTCAGPAAVAASALAVQSACSASRSACTSQNATPGPAMP